MKLLISCDMEGISGVVNWDQVDPDHAEFGRFRRLLTEDVNAAVRAASRSGAADILVTDGHDRKTNILIEELDPHAALYCGGPSPLAMVQGIDEGIDGAIFLGYHARAGTLNAILPHSGPEFITNVWVNGRVAGELGMNALVCGHFGVPVLLAIGDQALCAEALEWIPDVHTVITKQAVGFSAARCLPRELVQSQIEAATAEAVSRYLARRAPAALAISRPVCYTIEFIDPERADRVDYLPGVTRIDGRQILFQAPDASSAYRMFRAVIGLARS